MHALVDSVTTFVLDVLRNQAALVVFLVIGGGYLLDRVRLGGVQLGASTGTLLGGLVLGHLGLHGSGGSQSIGFMLFIYCVGLRAGPQFFSAFRENGARFAALALVVAACGVAGALALGRQLGLPPGYPAGLLAGALTSTPTLVAAQDAVRTGVVTLPAGVDSATVLGNIAASYAISYVIGMFGLLALVSLLPRVMGIDLRAEARRLAEERAGTDGVHAAPSYADLPVLRVYRVAHDGDGRETLSALRRAGCFVQALKRDGALLDPARAPALVRDDLVAVLAPRPAHRAARELLGPETVEPDLLETRPETRTILVTGASAGRATLARVLDFQCIAVKLVRAGLDLPIGAHEVLAKGDLVVAVGLPARLDALAQDIGRSARPENEADLVTFALGMAAGIGIGLLTVSVAGIPLGLGSAGGLLLSGLVVGFARTSNPTFGQLPVAATSVLMELGLQFFMANVGLEAGGSIVGALRTTGPWLPVAAFVVLVAPLLVGFVVGRLVLGFDAVILLGALTGALTSTPALDLVNRQAESPLPTLGYAGTYAFANVLLAVAGSVLMRL